MELLKQTIPLPGDATRPVKLADWVEMSVLTQKDQTVSRADIMTSLESYQTKEEVEDIIDKIWAEIELRQLYLEEQYPFELKNREILIWRNGSSMNWSYIFCLFISYVGIDEGHKLKWWNKSKLTYLFEVLCTEVAKKFICDGDGKGESLQFGSPRSAWPPAHKYITDAVIFLRNEIKEGDIILSPRRTPSIRRGDGGDNGLDVVAWRHFSDNRIGKLLVFGQCTTSKKDYIRKLNEVSNFLSQRLCIHTSHISAFFLPHLLSDNDDDYREEWQKIARCPSIPFDRIRISYYGRDWKSPEFETLFRRLVPIIKDTNEQF